MKISTNYDPARHDEDQRGAGYRGSRGNRGTVIAQSDLGVYVKISDGYIEYHRTQPEKTSVSREARGTVIAQSDLGVYVEMSDGHIEYHRTHPGNISV